MIIDTGLGWRANSDYLVNESGTYLSTQSARFTKTNNGYAVAVHFHSTNGWYGPVLLSTSIENVYYSPNNASSTLLSFEYLGLTWYCSTNNYWSHAADSPAIPSFAGQGSTVNSAEAIRILQTAEVSLTPLIPTYTVMFNANGGTGEMEPQTIEVDSYTALNICTFSREGYTFIGWSTTSTGSVNYTDGDTVYNLAAEGETATLYAVWRKNPPYLIIQENRSEIISLTKDLVDILQTPFTLKDETSIIDPVFVINCPLDSLFRANYLTAPSLGRKYFIQDIVSMTNDLVELTCHVDVLSTYASEIRANKGIIFRQQNDWNLYLNDGVIQAYQNPIVTTQKFPKGFTQQNYVLVCAGSRNIGGVVIGDGGSIDTTYPEEAGGGNLDSKTTSGLVNYCKAQVGKPYWYGTFGQIATADLLDWRRADYEAYYPDPGSPAFVDQIGQRVHDCVGLIKGYRWSQTPTSVPQYVAAQDVDVKGLWSQCNKLHGNVDFSYTSNLHLIGMCVFDSSLTHVGVYIGNGRIIEAQNHANGVVNNDAYARRAKFTLWGVPDWLKITTAEG